MDYFSKIKVAAWILLVLLVAEDYVVDASHATYEEFQSVSIPTTIAKHHHHRTAYHFQPPKHWINDPNGPMYYNGVYHLFYQYNPNGSVWGNIVWAHSVSTDLINWIPLEPAIYPSKSFDQYGTWSGSATILPGNKPVIFYTGIIDANQTQVQNYAVPANLSDPYLREWVKPDDNPLIVSDPSVNKTAFRDPTTAWRTPDGHWKILVGGRRSERGMAYLYRSRDLKKWVKAKHPLHSKGETGNWECPDFYPVAKCGQEGLDTSAAGQNVKHVLKVSLDRTRFDIYTIGTYYNIGGGKERFVPDSDMVDGLKAMRYDWGNCYASKTFFDPVERRRVLWIWANESDPVQDDINKGWAGIQLIPRTITLDPNGKQLLQWPVPELKTLRDQNTLMINQELKKGAVVEVPVKWPAQADVEVTFTFSSLDSAEPFDPKWRDLYPQDVCSRRRSSVEGGLGPFGLLTLASRHLEEYTPVFFRVFKDGNKHVVLMCSDGTSSTLAKGDYYKPSFAGYVDVDLSDKKLSLRSLIDHSVVESFGAKGKTVITSRVYPTLATGSNAHLFVFNNGSETVTIETLMAWNMKRPHMNQNH